MENIKELLTERLLSLLRVRESAARSLQTAPEGRLRIRRSKGTPRYYHRTDSNSRTGTCIKKAERNLAAALAAKEYHQKIVAASDQEIKAIRAYLSAVPEVPAEKIYEQLPESRRELVFPLWETEEEFVSRWQDRVFTEKEVPAGDLSLITDRNDLVRSGSKRIIADALNRYRIPYRCACPVCLDHFGTVYPDFTVLNIPSRKEVLWEHMNRMDEPEVAEKSIRKIQAYMANGYYPGEDLILTFETRTSPLSTQLVSRILERYFLVFAPDIQA